MPARGHRIACAHAIADRSRPPSASDPLAAASAFALIASASTVVRAQGGYDPVLTTIEVRQLVASTAPGDQAKLAAHFTALADRHATEAASTADHRTLQDYFLALARRSDGEAADHAGMAASYRTTKTLAGMATHCDRLAGEIRAVAAEARAAATMHGTLASAAK